MNIKVELFYFNIASFLINSILLTQQPACGEAYYPYIKYCAMVNSFYYFQINIFYLGSILPKSNAASNWEGGGKRWVKINEINKKNAKFKYFKLL